MRTARSKAWSSSRNVRGEEIWYGRFEVITSNRGQSTRRASPWITSTCGRRRRRYGANRGPEHGGHGVRARGETVGREREGLARPVAREYDLRLERTDRAPGRIGEGHRERVLEDDREHVVAALDLSRDLKAGSLRR